MNMPYNQEWIQQEDDRVVESHSFSVDIFWTAILFLSVSSFREQTRSWWMPCWPRETERKRACNQVAMPMLLHHNRITWNYIQLSYDRRYVRWLHWSTIRGEILAALNTIKKKGRHAEAIVFQRALRTIIEWCGEIRLIVGCSMPVNVFVQNYWTQLKYKEEHESLSHLADGCLYTNIIDNRETRST